MQYRHTEGHPQPLSALGFGCMRFPKRHGRIDEEATFALLRRAVDQGVNYFDTAYIYPGSEELVGKFFQQEGCREKVHIATKLPHYLIKSAQDMDKYFDEQLRRLRTDYVDYYLMHMLPDVKTWERLKELGIEAWIERKKASGQIRQLGFSFHGNTRSFCELVDVRDWDFCQIQYNYMDEHSQAGRAGLEHAAQKGLPVVIMEPLRGGRLTGGLPAGAKKLLQKEKTSPAALAFRWLWDQSGVTVILSGMNRMEDLEENLAAACAALPGCFTQGERELVEAVRREIKANVKVGCTGCGYCMPCPQGVDIPGVFRCYNEMAISGKISAFQEYFQCTTMGKNTSRASQCIKCGKCMQHCPQSIPIPDKLAQAAGELEIWPYRVVAWGAKKLLRF